jgi:hypothetical protein
MVHHSPRFRTTLEPGTFRTEAYEQPVSSALMNRTSGGMYAIGQSTGAGGAVADAAAVGRPGNAPGELALKINGGRVNGAENERDDKDLRGLVARFVAEQRGARALGVRPVSIAFPQIGPMLYLASELTPEGNAPEISLRYKREGN